MWRKKTTFAAVDVLIDYGYSLSTDLFTVDLTEGRTTHINIPGMVGDYLLPSDIYKSSKLETVFCF